MSSLRRLTLLLSAALTFSACNTVTDLVASNLPAQGKGKPSIVIRLGEQRAYLYRGKSEVAASRISSGGEGYGTPIGRFRVIRKHEDHRSGIYGDYVDEDDNVVKANVDVRKHRRPRGTHYVGAPMPYYVEFRPGYGLHAGNLPGYPASHGCVRLPYWRARQFYHAARIGTPVTVQR